MDASTLEKLLSVGSCVKINILQHVVCSSICLFYVTDQNVLILNRFQEIHQHEENNQKKISAPRTNVTLKEKIRSMQREEKQLDAALSAILSRVNDLKTAITAMIAKLENEHETINWPTFLDNYAILSGHLTGLSKILEVEMVPSLRSFAVLPLQLGCERDETLVQMTEGRVPACTHTLVPDLLRTKPEPQAEQRLNAFNHKASTLNYDNALKQVTQFNKVVSHVWEIISKGREDWEGESLRSGGMPQTYNIADTHALVTAVGSGKGLRVGPVQPGVVGAPGMVPPRGQAPPMPNPSSMAKAPSTIKTNIKAATQIHPYQR